MDPWTVDPLDLGAWGPMDNWTVLALDRFTIGPFALWNFGKQGSVGPFVVLQFGPFDPAPAGVRTLGTWDV